MSHGAQTQKQSPGRLAICSAAVSTPRLPRISWAVVQRSRPVGGRGEAVQRQQQRAAGCLRQGTEAQGMDKPRDHSQSQTRIARNRLSLRNPQGPETQQGELVCADLANARLVVRDGHQAGGLHSERLSENRFRPPKNEVESALIATENEVSPCSTTSENVAMRGVLPPLSTTDSEEYLDIAICTGNTRGGNKQ